MSHSYRCSKLRPLPEQVGVKMGSMGDPECQNWVKMRSKLHFFLLVFCGTIWCFLGLSGILDIFDTFWYFVVSIVVTLGYFRVFVCLQKQHE